MDVSRLKSSVVLLFVNMYDARTREFTEIFSIYDGGLFVSL